MTPKPTKKSTYQVLEGRDEEIHTEDTGDVSRVITEEDTTEGSEGTHQVSLDGDGGLDASSVDAAPADRANTTGHLNSGSSSGRSSYRSGGSGSQSKSRVG